MNYEEAAMVISRITKIDFDNNPENYLTFLKVKATLTSELMKENQELAEENKDLMEEITELLAG